MIESGWRDESAVDSAAVFLLLLARATVSICSYKTLQCQTMRKTILLRHVSPCVWTALGGVGGVTLPGEHELLWPLIRCSPIDSNCFVALPARK